MSEQPGVKVIQYSANNAIEVTCDYMLEGKRSPLKRGGSRLRLGRGNNSEEIIWTRCLDCRGDYQNGHVEEYLEDIDLPQSGEGKNVYGQFLFEPVYVINETTGKKEENDEGEIVLSKIATLISLANAAKYKALLRHKAKSASAHVS